MIRIPNPKSDIFEYITIVSLLEEHTKTSGQPTFTFDDISLVLASKGKISSQKAVGSQAVQASFRKDRSLDGVFNQSKALSEVLRLMGLMGKVENQHTFRLTIFGQIVAQYPHNDHPEYKRGVLHLLRWSFVNMNFKHPLIQANADCDVKPFSALIACLPSLEGFITKAEINYVILTLKTDNKAACKQAIQDIQRLRKEAGYFHTYKSVQLRTAQIAEATADNYTRIPISFLQQLGILQKKTWQEALPILGLTENGEYFLGEKKAKNSTEVFIAGGHFQEVSEKLHSSESVTFARFERYSTAEKIAMSIKCLLDSFSDLPAQNPPPIQSPNLPEKYRTTPIYAFPYQLLTDKESIEFERYLASMQSSADINFWLPHYALQRSGQRRIWYELPQDVVSIRASLHKHPIAAIRPKEAENISWTSFSCVNCQPRRCCEYSSDELRYSTTIFQEIPDSQEKQVCPTGAISISAELVPTLDYNKCIDCGVCISRCNFGAIYYENNALTISTRLSAQNLTSSDAEEPTQYFTSLNVPRHYSISDDEVLAQCRNFFNKVKTLRKNEFYPLVRNLFRSLGFKAKIGRSGDTQWRYDALVLEPFVMPIEIKSPTEVQAISPDAVRQAIENSITIEGNHHLTRKAISAVVALLYSNERSASKDMLTSANDLHNIRILLVSVVVLHYLNLKNLDNYFLPQDIQFLFQSTIGAFDEEAIKEFWLHYLARRLEFDALGKESRYSSVAHEVFMPDEFMLQDKLKSEVEAFKAIYDLIRPTK
ncbi:MAG: hypothetical protein EAZ92_12680 [Candidatus Kapaibacterium sp.]|nr:MAG: hypothetical protein EAZ92_12680 [Candidatus Kapabacteria bacterium]